MSQKNKLQINEMTIYFKKYIGKYILIFKFIFKFIYIFRNKHS